MKIVIQFSLVLLLFCNFNVFGQDIESEIQDNHDSNVEGHDHHSKKNLIGVFTGLTTQLDGDKNTDFTLGIDYVRHFSNSDRWGIGVFGEVIFAEHNELIFGIPVYFFPTNNFWLRAGPALEIFKEEEESDSGITKTTTETGFAIRAGLGYDIEIMGFTIVPNVSVDFIREKTSLIWGFHMARRF